MPQVTVYIRNEDIDKWKAIEKKSQWMSHHLNDNVNIEVSPEGYIQPKEAGKPSKYTSNYQAWQVEEPTLVQEDVA